MRTLGVYHREALVGTVSADEEDRFRFSYDGGWMGRADAFPISHSLPLQSEPHAGEVAHAFFANLLPEGRIRTLVARRLGISESNDFELLAALGGECAGALVLSTKPPEPARFEYRPLSEEEIAALAKTGAVFAETSGAAGVRLSLAGAQDKLPVLVKDGRLYLPLGSSPSSHILKFANRDYKHLPANEAFVTELARGLGLPCVKSGLHPLAKERHLLVERYDRTPTADAKMERLHQEDFCQAMGLRATRKYEAEGGPTFSSCFRLVLDASAEPAIDARSLLLWQAFNAIVGNTDGHAKNLSLLRSAEGGWRLAPFYDLLCTAVYPRLDRRLAMNVGGEAEPGRIRGRDWRALAEQIEVRPQFVVDMIRSMAERIPALLDELARRFKSVPGGASALPMLVPRIRKQVRRTLQMLKE